LCKKTKNNAKENSIKKKVPILLPLNECTTHLYSSTSMVLTPTPPNIRTITKLKKQNKKMSKNEEKMDGKIWGKVIVLNMKNGDAFKRMAASISFLDTLCHASVIFCIAIGKLYTPCTIMMPTMEYKNDETFKLKISFNILKKKPLLPKKRIYARAIISGGNVKGIAEKEDKSFFPLNFLFAQKKAKLKPMERERREERKA